MDTSSIRGLIIDRIKELQFASGLDEPEVNEGTQPFLEIEDFDSLRASELGVALCDDLGIEFKDLKDVLFSDENVRISEIVKGIEETLK